MTDLIKRDDALAACDIAPPDEWNDYTKGGYDFAAEECKRNIAALPTIDPAAIRISRNGEHLFNTAKSLGWKDDGEGALEFIMRRTRYVAFEDTAAIREAALQSRIEELDARNKELTLQLLAAHGQAADALDKLAKAVEALEYYNVAGHEGKEARAVLAELEGK